MKLREPLMSISICLSLLCSPAVAGAQETFSGRVLKTIDGDTVSFLHEGETVKIHLAGIDTPEIDQPNGKSALRFTASHLLGRDEQFSIQKLAKDESKGLEAWVTFPDGTNLNHELLRAGLAWWRRKDYPDNQLLNSLEQEARKGKLGLWGHEKPIPPWEWREGKR